MATEYLENKNRAEKGYPYIDLKIVNFDYVAHYHEEIEVIYVVSGDVLITVDGEERKLSRGDIYLVMPGEIHSFTSIEQNSVYVMKINTFSDMLYSRIDGLITKDNSCYGEFKSLIDKIAFEDTSKHSGYRYAVNMYTNELLLNIIRLLNPVKIPSSLRKNLQKKLYIFNLVSEYLEEHYTEKITLDSVSAHLNYSTYYFAHLFKEITNQSFGDYVTDFRLEKFLSSFSSNASVTQTALDCGFGTLRSFNRAFKKRYEMTPLEYKRQGQ